MFLAAKGGLLRVQYLHKASFKPLLERAHLPDMRFHELRHTYGTMMLVLGTHHKVVQEAMGHAKSSTTLDIYSHVAGTLGKSAGARVDATFAKKARKLK